MRIRLKAQCFLQNRLCEAGDIIDLPDGVRGPHRAVQKTLDKISYDPTDGLDANRLLGEVVDEPLFDEVKEDGA